jgi:hypothetical protein
MSYLACKCHYLLFAILSFPITGRSFNRALCEFIVRSNYLLSINTEVFIASNIIESLFNNVWFGPRVGFVF